MIGSLNCTSPGNWSRVEDAVVASIRGNALELNVYSVPSNPIDASVRAGDRARRLIDTVSDEAVAAVNVPVSVKVGPYYTNLGNIARSKSSGAGAKGLVVFNRFLQPDVDADAMDAFEDAAARRPGNALARHGIALLAGRTEGASIKLRRPARISPIFSTRPFRLPAA